MATTLYPVDDRQAWKTHVTWAGARDASTGASNISLSAVSAAAVRATYFSGQYYVSRTNVVFDVSSITSKPFSAHFMIQGFSNAGGDMRLVRGEHGGSYFVQFPGVVGWSNGVDNTSNATILDTGEITEWNLNAYNTIQLNDGALDLLVSLSEIDLMLIDNDFDLTNNTPTDTNSNSGVYFSEAGGLTADPKLVIEANPPNSTLMGANF
jgi:hypothetical protein